jgi:predicted secreted protein
VNIALEMKRLNIDTLGISEVRWIENDRVNTDQYKFIYAGGQKVGIMVRKTISQRIEEVKPISDRVIAVKINAKPKPIIVIQIYALTSNKEDEKVKEFYEKVEEALKKVRKDSLIVIMGNFNAKIGQGKVGDTVGNFGLGERNDRGDRMIEFAEKENMVVCNTIFKHHPRIRLYTWQSPGGGIKNQIDYILINKRYRKIILNCHTFPSADCNSDHRLLMAKCQLQLKRIR